MARIAATKVQICLFWKSDLNYNEIAAWPAEMRAMWDAFGETIVQLRRRHGQNVPIEMYVCPITIPQNAVIIAQNNLDPSLLPAAQVYAEYSDDTAGGYFLSRTLSERFSGIKWRSGDVKPYVEALLYRAKPSEQSIICKLVPPLCSVGGWVWLGLAAAATIKAASTQGQPGKTMWWGGTFLLWKEWADRGGLAQLSQK